ncbi:MAG: aminotransferase class I/II-fold pyridoxal phosphate-dependent enzyme [Anaerolineales bacterium]|nr:aminotransferase class I/II-fold pyridoxal phosphate-dependent enzyme [Anaerolineales bacterium]
MRAEAKRTSALPVNYFAKVVSRIAELQDAGVDVIRLDIGSPDLPPPEAVIAKLKGAASKPDRHGYGSHKGPLELREAWSELYSKRFGVKLDQKTEVLPLVGSKEGIFHVAQALVDPGDVVLVPDPGYQTYTQGARFAGGEPYFMPLHVERKYLPDFEAVPEEIAGRAKLLWLNYPNNPTGAVASDEFFEDAVTFAREHDILLCHDAAYTQVTFDEYKAPSVLQVPGSKEVAVEFNSLSKSHNMAGWRTAAAVGNSDALDSLYRLKTHVDSGHFMPIHEASTEALATDHEWINARNGIYQGRRDLVVRALRELGVIFDVPKGALYLWFACPEGFSSTDFTWTLLEEAGVSLVPGVIFGAYGDGFVRLSLCVPEERLEEAMGRLSGWWGGR